MPGLSKSDAAQARQVFTTIKDTFNNLADAKNCLVHMYVPDMAYSRAALCEAERRLELHYRAVEDYKEQLDRLQDGVVLIQKPNYEVY